MRRPLAAAAPRGGRPRAAAPRSGRSRDLAAALLAVAVLVLGVAEAASAHAGLTRSDPPGGATLGAAPSSLRLAFSEPVEASLSSVTVTDSRGAARPASVAAGGAASLTAVAADLPRGVYTVAYRVVSSVDGHATSGSFGFGVGVPPGRAAAAAAVETQEVRSALELPARALLLLGLVLLVGATTAIVAGYGYGDGAAPSRGAAAAEAASGEASSRAAAPSLRLAATGWAASVAGLVLLAEAQRRGVGASIGDLLRSEIGDDLARRGAAVVAAGALLVLAHRRRNGVPARKIVGPRTAVGLAGLAAGAAIVAHVASGHAAAGGAVEVVGQSAHFIAAGVWFGGLAALLVAVRGAPSAAKDAAVKRFSIAAAGALVVVAVTGMLRAIDELGRFDELWSTGYGRAILAKSALFAGLVALGARNRARSVPAARTDLKPLRRISRFELAGAAATLVVAGVLAALAPPLAAQPATLPTLTATGADFATTTRVQLTTASADAGPNTFVARVTDYDTEEPVRAKGVTLRFSAPDDPEIAPTALALTRRADGAWTGTGANLAFDGRWKVNVEVDGGAEVPLELDVRGARHHVRALRVPGRPPVYTMQLIGAGSLRVEPSRRRTVVTGFDVFENEASLKRAVLTLKRPGRPTSQLPLHRLSESTFVTETPLPAGRATLAIVARKADDDLRMRGAFAVRVP